MHRLTDMKRVRQVTRNTAGFSTRSALAQGAVLRTWTTNVNARRQIRYYPAQRDVCTWLQFLCRVGRGLKDLK